MEAADGAREAAVRAHFRRQAESCARLGSPFMATLLAGLAEGLDRATATGRRALGWPGDPGEDALALRLAGGLNALARSGRAPGLAAAWPGLGGEPDGAGAAAAALAALPAHDAWLAPWLDAAPQTNEARRAAALLGALRILGARGWRRADLLEIGASAGLGLLVDRCAWDLGRGRRAGPADGPPLASDWRGASPEGPAPEIAARAGCDLAPVDPGDPAQRERMLAFVWADQIERRAMLEVALDAAARAPWRVERGEAGAWLAQRLAAPQTAGRVVWHSIMLQYLPAERRAAVERALAEAGARATPERPLARVAMEADARPGSAALTLTVWPGGRPEALGRADFHGRRIDWGAA